MSLAFPTTDEQEARYVDAGHEAERRKAMLADGARWQAKLDTEDLEPVGRDLIAKANYFVTLACLGDNRKARKVAEEIADLAGGLY